MFDGMVRELKEVRYVPQFKRNLISVGALKTLGFVVSIRDGVLKMTKGSMVVMKGVRRIYYLKGSTVTGQVETFISLNDVCTQVWQLGSDMVVKSLYKLQQTRDHLKAHPPVT